MPLLLVALCIAGVIGIYFTTNPMRHGRRFMMRRFVNWFPLGMTYAFLYMARYNLNVAKNALGSRMSNEDFGWIFFAGTVTYAFSFLPNGPLVDKIGGKRGIVISAVGASVANILLGVLTWLVVTNRIQMKLVAPFSFLYALNMYFQSYGAMSIIKVKAYWFHVRERGVFGAVFGTLISIGVYLAFDWGQAIADMAKAHPGADLGWLQMIVQNLIQTVFALKTSPVDAIWAVFFIPAAILIFWAILDCWLIVDTPEQANFPAFDTHDASSGQMHVELTTRDLLKKVFASRLMLLLAGVELTAGVLRNGTMQWHPVFAKELKLRSLMFSAGDLKDEAGIAARLQTLDGMSALVNSNLAVANRPATSSADPGKALTKAEDPMVVVLNETIQGPAIYEPGRFAKVNLRPETAALAAQSPHGQDLIRLNRLLLEDACPSELRRWQRQPAAEFFTDHWGLLLCIFGIIGGFSGGLVSDRFFQSRRGPPAALLCGFMFLLTIVMAVFLPWPAIVGSAAVLISMAVIGVHSLMSGTAAADFGGRKATATCSGIVDGFVYLGSGIQSVSLGYLTHWTWLSWPLFMMPFALIGGFIALKFWHELPEATKRYNAEAERKAGLGMDSSGIAQQ